MKDLQNKEGMYRGEVVRTTFPPRAFQNVLLKWKLKFLFSHFIVVPEKVL